MAKTKRKETAKTIHSGDCLSTEFQPLGVRFAHLGSPVRLGYTLTYGRWKQCLRGAAKKLKLSMAAIKALPLYVDGDLSGESVTEVFPANAWDDDEGLWMDDGRNGYDVVEFRFSKSAVEIITRKQKQ